jgi:hypothetical protein
MKIHPYGTLVVLLSFPLAASLTRTIAAPHLDAARRRRRRRSRPFRPQKRFWLRLDDRLRAKASVPLNVKNPRQLVKPSDRFDVPKRRDRAQRRQAGRMTPAQHEPRWHWSRPR